MLIGVSTDNFASRPTPLSKDIADILQFKVKAIEIVPKTPADLRKGGALREILGKFEYVAVLLPPPPATAKDAVIGDISKYYQDGLEFSADVGARLVMIRPDFPKCGVPGDVIKNLQSILTQAMNIGLNIALLNWFAPESQCGTIDQVSEVLKAVNCKLAIDLGHALRGMGPKSVWIVGEQKERLAAIRASDATIAFGDLPLGTGHVNYPMIMPLLEENGFSGPFFVSQSRDPRPENILSSISYLEYFEI
jgi:sugar phosphate isomerase/epimerase